MRAHVRLAACLSGLFLIGFGCVAAQRADAQLRLTTLYSFPNDGLNQEVWGGVVSDSKGALYGTTCRGGTNGEGSVFKLKPPGTAGEIWSETVIYSFQGLAAGDGACPRAGLIIDAASSLYGTTSQGGIGCPTVGCGVVFKLDPPLAPEGSWTESIIWRFRGAPGAETPLAPLVMSSTGRLYGTTWMGGANGFGSVFQLVPPASPGSSWSESIIHSFGALPDGQLPFTSPLVLDQAGLLYGTTQAGGASGRGSVFKLTPPANAGEPWTETILHNFRCQVDGCDPLSGVVFDQDGKLYGTTTGGNGRNPGTVFQLSPPAIAGGQWTGVTIHFFDGANGAFPLGNLLVNNDGALFGTTSGGGSPTCPSSSDGACGVIFRLRPPTSPGGPWASDVIYKFMGDSDGSSPNYGGLSFGVGLHGQTQIYGVTLGAVPSNTGVVYQLEHQ